MKVALIDVDNTGKKKITFPNLPLMKISAWHKAHGDNTEWWFPHYEYHIAYKSKVFTFSPEPQQPIKAKSIITGGTGYGLKDRLPYEIEHIMPDYSLYPGLKSAYGFLTRGCPNACGFCIVTPKEGAQSERVADLSEFWSGQKLIKLLDPNLLACPDHEDLLQQLIDSRAEVDFTQGLDIRRVTDRNIELLKRIRVSMIHFAWDRPEQDLSEKFQYFKAATGLSERKLGVYVLTNFGSSLEQDLHRIYTLRDLGYTPYVMIYDKQNAPRQTRLLQRWVNNKRIFGSVARFEDYDPKKG